MTRFKLSAALTSTLLAIAASAVAQPAPDAPADPTQVAPPRAPDPVITRLVLVPTPLPAVLPPAPTGPVRSGFTVGIDAGVGHVRASAEGYEEERTELSGMNLSIGTFVSPRLAVGLRLSGTTFEEDDVRFTHAFAGLHLQYYAGDKFFIGGGAGAAIFTAPFEEDFDPHTGWAVNFRTGIDLYQNTKGAVQLALEVTPSKIDVSGTDVTFTSIGLQLGIQHF